MAGAEKIKAVANPGCVTGAEKIKCVVNAPDEIPSLAVFSHLWERPT